MTLERDLQAAAESGSLVIGTEETLKNISSLDSVVVSSNAPAGLREKVNNEADKEEVDVREAGMDNEELGSLCMKPYSASVVGMRNQG